jgi:hypothetical protein
VAKHQPGVKAAAIRVPRHDPSAASEITGALDGTADEGAATYSPKRDLKGG